MLRNFLLVSLFQY